MTEGQPIRVFVCHNCEGYGITLGPVMVPAYDDAPDARAADEDAVTETMRQETTVYRCQACDGDGYLQLRR